TMSSKIQKLGIVVAIVGLWGAAVPYAGPVFGYDMGGGSAWTWTESRFTLHLLPGLLAVLGGMTMMMGSGRGRMRVGAALGALGGAWFIVGPVIRPAWANSDGMMMMGNGVWDQIFTSLGYHYGTGVVILALSAFALGVSTDVEAGDSPRTESTEPGSDVPIAGNSTSDQELVTVA
ncbi:MAG: hypothetical protein M3487_03440, partial [Actinomycetota bacterium]|nr:hypothetical protein [Actinomycetota bacterium]